MSDLHLVLYGMLSMLAHLAVGWSCVTIIVYLFETTYEGVKDARRRTEELVRSADQFPPPAHAPEKTETVPDDDSAYEEVWALAQTGASKTDFIGHLRDKYTIIRNPGIDAGKTTH